MHKKIVDTLVKKPRKCMNTFMYAYMVKRRGVKKGTLFGQNDINMNPDYGFIFMVNIENNFDAFLQNLF